jgi:hypothetical protein
VLTAPKGWTTHAGANLVTFTPPGDPVGLRTTGGEARPSPLNGRARLTVHERLPVRPLAALVDELLAADPAFRVTARGAAERLATTEGEHAAWLALAGASPEGAARRWIGAVFLDEFVTLLDALCEEPGLEETVERAARAALLGASFGLGARRRRFVYRAPAGWLGVPGGLATTWYPPRFPRRRAALVVHPAEPCREGATSAFAGLLDDERRRGFTLAGAIRDDAVVARDGLAGRCFRLRGRWRPGDPLLERHTAVLTDGRHRYVMTLDAHADLELGNELAALAELARSVEPLPRAQEPVAAATALAAPVTHEPPLAAQWVD